MIILQQQLKLQRLERDKSQIYKVLGSKLKSGTNNQKGSDMHHKRITSKLALAALAIGATTLIGTTGAATAAQMPNSKEACKKGGWQQLGYSNQGQCVKAFNQNKPGNGYGGGNNNHPKVDVNLDVSGDNNIINIIFHFFFG